ncbi:hypothetical protein D9M71_414530 [compost metagenome]
MEARIEVFRRQRIALGLPARIKRALQGLARLPPAGHGANALGLQMLVWVGEGPLRVLDLRGAQLAQTGDVGFDTLPGGLVQRAEGVTTGQPAAAGRVAGVADAGRLALHRLGVVEAATEGQAVVEGDAGDRFRFAKAPAEQGLVQLPGAGEAQRLGDGTNTEAGLPGRAW